jgi:shikimate dehydrogenase
MSGASVAVIGAGGAARAALLALVELEPERILLFTRNVSKAQQAVDSLSSGSLVEAVNVKELPQSPVPDRIDVIVQTTPIGLDGKWAPIAWLDYFIQPEIAQLFFDMVYSADGKETPLVEHFANRGVRSVDGTDMLVEQACFAFEFWTGRMPPAEIMKAALEAARSNLKSRQSQ